MHVSKSVACKVSKCSSTDYKKMSAANLIMSLPYLLIHKYSLQPARQLHLHCVKVGAICRILVLHIAPSTEETDRQRTISWNHLCARLTPKLSSSWHIYVFLASKKKAAPIYHTGTEVLLRTAREGNVFRSVWCHSVHGRGVGDRADPHYRGRPSSTARPPPSRGRPPVLTSSGGHCSGRYVFYWTAFLYYK